MIIHKKGNEYQMRCFWHGLIKKVNQFGAEASQCLCIQGSYESGYQEILTYSIVGLKGYRYLCPCLSSEQSP